MYPKGSGDNIPRLLHRLEQQQEEDNLKNQEHGGHVEHSNEVEKHQEAKEDWGADWENDERPVATREGLIACQTLGSIARFYRMNKFNPTTDGDRLRVEVERKHKELLSELREKGKLDEPKSFEEAMDHFYAMISNEDRKKALGSAVEFAKNESEIKKIEREASKAGDEFWGFANKKIDERSDLAN